MHKETGERRDFLPPLVARLHKLGAAVCLEHGYRSGIGLAEADYLKVAPAARYVSHAEAYQQPIVLVLRCPADHELRAMAPGACLISMLHYPTRPERVTLLRGLGLEAISLDSIAEDSGRRLIENLRAVAWNGLEVGFQTLRRLYPPPGFDSPRRPPIQVTLLGAGAVGSHTVQAAVRSPPPARRFVLLVAGRPPAGVHGGLWPATAAGAANPDRERRCSAHQPQRAFL
jgi:alanine dehydrogenase